MRLLLLSLFTLTLSGAPALAMPSAVAAIGTFVGTLAATTAGATMLQIGASIAFTYLARALRGKPDVGEPVAGRFIEYTYGETRSPLRVIWGLYATRGHALGPPYSGRMEASGGSGGVPNKFLVTPTILSDMPIAELMYCVVDGEDQHFDASGGGGRSFRMLGVMAGPNSAAPSVMMANFAGGERPWRSDMIGRNMAWILPRYHTGTDEEDQRWGGSPPTPLWVVRGARLLDPRTGQVAYTENPVVMIWNILRGVTIPGVGTWGVGVPEGDLPEAHWFSAMDVCDEVSPGGERRYRAGLEFGLDEEPLDVIQEFLRACGGEIADCGGEWRIAVGPPAPSVHDFTDDDVSVTDPRNFRPFEGLDNIFNGVSAKYLDPRNGWEPTEAVPYVNSTWEAEDRGHRQHADLDLRAVPFPGQVRRLMRELASDNRRMRVHELVLGPAAVHVMPLDTVRWTSQENGYITKLFEVLEKSLDPITLNSTLLLRERDPSDYDWDQDFDDILPEPPSRINDDRTIYGVEGFDCVGSSIGGASGDNDNERPTAYCTWDLRGIDGLEIEISHATSGQIVANARLGPATVNRGNVHIAEGIMPLQSLRARARAVAAGRPSTWSAYVPFQTLGVYLGYADVSAQVAADINAANQTAQDAADTLAEYADELFLKAKLEGGKWRLRYYTLDGIEVPGDIVLHGDVAIADDSILAPQIFVTSLSALSANLGSIQVDTANIANAAIKTAKIDDLQTTTGKLSLNAVTDWQNWTSGSTTLSFGGMTTQYMSFALARFGTSTNNEIDCEITLNGVRQGYSSLQGPGNITVSAMFQLVNGTNNIDVSVGGGVLHNFSAMIVKR